MKGKGIMRAVVLTALALFISGTVLAQQGEAPSDNMQIVKEKIQADKKLFIAQNMQLTENEAAAFWPVYDSYQKDLTALNDRAFKNVADYAASYDKMTDDIANKLLNDYLSIESDRVKFRESYLSKFAKGVPYRKVMRYYQLENKIFALMLFDAAKKIPLAK